MIPYFCTLSAGLDILFVFVHRLFHFDTVSGRMERTLFDNFLKYQYFRFFGIINAQTHGNTFGL